MIQKERLKTLNTHPIQSREFVLYWMQASQRSEDNHALEYAIDQANDLDKPLIVFFGLTDNYPDANERHYVFMLEGLREVWRALKERGIKFFLSRQSPEKGIVHLAARACLTVVDRGYTRIQRKWRQEAAEKIDNLVTPIKLHQIAPETDPPINIEVETAPSVGNR